MGDASSYFGQAKGNYAQAGHLLHRGKITSPTDPMQIFASIDRNNYKQTRTGHPQLATVTLTGEAPSS
jgi:hypothetical protein